jgi:hypothetical protein
VPGPEGPQFERVILATGCPHHPYVPFLEITASLDPAAKLDENRMLVTEKVFGFLIAAIAVQLVLDGLVSVGVIGPVPH